MKAHIVGTNIFESDSNFQYTDLYLSPAESPNFGKQENPLIFMLS